MTGLAPNRCHVRKPGTGGDPEAAYRRPYQMHGSIGPSCAVALFQDGRLTVWSHAQGMFPLRTTIAEDAAASRPKRCDASTGGGRLLRAQRGR